MTATPSIAVVIVNYRSPELTLGALDALAGERAGLPGLRAIVVDGGSGDGSADKLSEGLRDPRFQGWASLLALPINGGFGWANNQAILRLLQGPTPPDYIHLLNPDTRVEPGAVRALADELAAYPRCGAVGSLLLDPDGTPSGSAFAFPTLAGEFARGSRIGAIRRALRVKEPMLQGAGPVDWVTGASVMIRAEALKASGLFDDGFFLYFEEVELMWRLTRAGWEIRHQPASRVIHDGGAATGVNMSGREAYRRPPLPAYWYRSRRRFFTLTNGATGGSLASALFLAGRMLSPLRSVIEVGKPRMRIANELRDVARHGTLPVAADHHPAPARWTDAPDQPPAWMAKG
ncbi:glycosyltransferase family 2 protein [Sphingomonas nostoxanthinifaciens]|uniref:glycosyltransferase family 2 protein n=1 Tax=Sphingomonas nostoxanthinifaciens TaxID=2872652 RepID=UPI001CC1D320|nr:glycosyltransferase family 2 protein [Sphingomonas nostoxanthinifaciens]UAK23436.1 glycosyltransferase family 2 protein [Sphingomonas nostoxanthinifaciens]